MSKKIFIVFLFALFLLPNLALADSIYQIQLFKDANLNGIYDPGSNKNEVETGSPITVCYDGFVPCGKVLCKELDAKGKCKNKDGSCITGLDYKDGKEKPIQCQLCHSFIMVDRAVDYVVTKLVPLLAVLMLVIGGVMFYFGGVRPELLSRAKTLIKGVVIGLVLIYSAYMIVNIFLMVLGASEINSVKDVFSNGVFSVKCPVYVPEGFFK
ncbi:MAG: pilin [bacterium]|nr:pilin [bacterium]